MPTKLTDSSRPGKFARRVYYSGRGGKNRCDYQPDGSNIRGDTHRQKDIRDMQAGCEALHDERITRRTQLYAGRRRQRNKERGEFHSRVAPRGCRAEAIAKVAQVGLAHTEIGTCKIVDLRTGGGLSIKDWATEADVSTSRVKGALYDLESCGHMGKWEVRAINKKGQTRARVTRRWFYKSFFESLHIDKFLKRAKKWKKNTGTKTAAREASAGNGPQAFYVRQLAASKAAPGLPSDREKELNRLKFEIGHDHPGLSAADVERIARDRLP